MKQIALFGGSFNPPHPGHFETARQVYKALGVDEVWFLFSENWQKDPSRYAPIEHRMEMGRILARHYPDMPFVMSAIEDDLGTHMTFEVLKKLREKFPGDRFIWVMGADSLAEFHTWKNAEDIIRNFPVVVVDRKPYTDAALGGPTALKFAFLKAASPVDLKNRNAGWCFLDGAESLLSSSGLIARMKTGQTAFDGPFQEIADYIVQNSLYGLAAQSGKAPPPGPRH